QDQLPPEVRPAHDHELEGNRSRLLSRREHIGRGAGGHGATSQSQTRRTTSSTRPLERLTLTRPVAQGAGNASPDNTPASSSRGPSSRCPASCSNTASVCGKPV